jgi:hypothetical protein
VEHGRASTAHLDAASVVIHMYSIRQEQRRDLVPFFCRMSDLQ